MQRSDGKPDADLGDRDDDARCPYWLDRAERRNRTHFARRPSLRERSREQVLRDWFGEERATGEILAHQSPAVHIAGPLDSALTRLGLRRPVDLERLRDDWAEIVGADLAHYCQPVALHGTCLDVEVVDAAWLYELRTMHSREIQARVERASEGRVNTVRFAPHGRRYNPGGKERG